MCFATAFRNAFTQVAFAKELLEGHHDMKTWNIYRDSLISLALLTADKPIGFSLNQHTSAQGSLIYDRLILVQR
jgi:hypothetical protein